MNTHPVDQYLRTLTRRQLFQRVGLGVGGFALANLLNNDLSASSKKIHSLTLHPRQRMLFIFIWLGHLRISIFLIINRNSRKETESFAPKKCSRANSLPLSVPVQPCSVHQRIQNMNLKNVENPVSGFPIYSPSADRGR